MENFTPVSGLIGGLLIGGAASLFVLLNGRIAGISGIFGGLFGGSRQDIAWRAAFVAGLVIGPLAVAILGGPVPEISLDASVPLLIVAGILVGYGAALGSGCTSGHGVCGIARGSPRSILSTVVYFSVAAATVFVMHHIVGA